MRKVLKNRKGFTLVELLAVIVILALIMGIAVAAMSGVIRDSQENSARRTAASLIDGVRSRLTLEGELRTGTYYFTNVILERGGKTSPLGGDYKYATTKPEGATDVATGVYKAATMVSNDTCSDDTAQAFVNITVADGQKAEYFICLPSGKGNEYVAGSETDILADADDVIKSATSE